jgi:hypothetical protein
VGPVHRLQVDLRVPVTVVQDDYVGGHEVETEATRSCRDQEDVYLTVGGGELVDLPLSSVQVSPSIQPTILMLAEATIILQDVQHSREPREDQYLIPVFLRPLDQLIDKDHFARTLDQMFA